MPAAQPTPPGEAGADCYRRRRTHKKSRRGCGNCKLRGVKCDEGRPDCKKCTSFGVYCNFDASVPELQMCFDAPPTLITQKSVVSTAPANGTLLSGVSLMECFYPKISDGVSDFQLDSLTLSRLDRFTQRTVLTIGGERSSLLYQRETPRVACLHPYLMHIVQAFTIIHDQYLATPFPATRLLNQELYYHWTSAVMLFRRSLAKPLVDADRDALWSAAAMISIISISAIDAVVAEEAWPLKPSDETDLEWLRLAEGKLLIWRLTNPLRPDSIFASLKDDFKDDGLPIMVENVVLDEIPRAFLQLCSIDEASTPENNAYLTTVQKLSLLLPLTCNRKTMFQFIFFATRFEPSFLQLLKMKDPRALLLLAYWYAKVCVSPQWWIVRRATLEGQAICIYLDRYHPEEELIQELLVFPKVQTGLLDVPKSDC